MLLGTHTLPERIRLLEWHLKQHRNVLFRKQHRDKKKITFRLKGSFQVGTGSTNVGNIQHVRTNRPGHVPFKGTAAFLMPVRKQNLKREVKAAYTLARTIIADIDPEYAAGEFMVNFGYINSRDHRVKKHTDSHDVSHQYALGLGSYKGAKLRIHHESGPIDVDYRHKVVKFDGRIPHEVVMDDDFEGERFSVIWFKNYDSRPEWITEIDDSEPSIVYTLP